MFLDNKSQKNVIMYFLFLQTPIYGTTEALATENAHINEYIEVGSRSLIHHKEFI